jgi:hypothetical protein
MYNELDGNTHALNRHLDEMDQHDAEEARFEAKVAEIVAEVINTGASGDFNLNEIMNDTILGDENGDLADLLTTLMLSKGSSQLLMMYIIFQVETQVREGTNAE